jgi:hypothetical protein
VRDECLAVPVYLQPGERLTEDIAVRERVLHAGTRAEVAQAPLQLQDLAEPLDVPPRER